MFTSHKEESITESVLPPEDNAGSLYVLDQLIPYIGNKRKLLQLIRKAIARTGVESGTFCDVFSGSTVVSRLAKTLGFSVIANDWEHYAEHLGIAYIKCNSAPPFHAFGGADYAIHRLNSLEPVKGYISDHYCPQSDEEYDVQLERMFYTQENGRRIDSMREQIAEWKESSLIDLDEESVLLSSLIFQSAYCSNTSGVFKGFHKGWGGATKTAWYRIRSLLTLRTPVFWDNGCVNRVYRMDASALADEVECDIAYLDPPYNQHQYGSNYHLLNTVALWDKPVVGTNFELRSKTNGKSAIRQDWLTERRSLYCYRSTACEAFRELVMKLRSRFILVSYSTDGIITFEEMLRILRQRGRISLVTQRYKRYRVSSQRPSLKSHNIEFVAIVETGEPDTEYHVRQIIDHISELRELQAENCQD